MNHYRHLNSTSVSTAHLCKLAYWDFYPELREETVAESEREAAEEEEEAMAAATGWNFGISRLSRGRHGVGVLSFSRAMTFSASSMASAKYHI